MSRENTSPLPHGDGEGRCLTSSPCAALLWSVALRGGSRSISCCVLRAVRERLQAAWRQCANHGSIGDSWPMALLGCPRGHTVARETHCLTRPGILTLEPVRSAAGRSHASVKLARSFGAERLGCLWLQLLGVEAFSFLPNAQGNGSDLARQRQARHRRLHAFGQQTFIELTEGAVDNAGRRRRTLTQVFQIVIVVAVESADEHRFLGAHQLSVLEAVIGAAARLQGQPAVGPELTFAAEAVRRLYPPDQ